jgi:hypothetical protein
MRTYSAPGFDAASLQALLLALMQPVCAGSASGFDAMRSCGASRFNAWLLVQTVLICSISACLMGMHLIPLFDAGPSTKI